MTNRKKILSAAVQLFSQKGFHQATMDDIAMKAEVAKGTLYYYFKSKSRLFTATVTEGMEQIITEIEAELISDLPFVDHFRRLIDIHITLYLKYGDLTKIVFSELSNSLDQDTLSRIDKVRERFINFIAGLLQDGIDRGYLKQMDAKLAALSVAGIFENLCNYYIKNPKTTDRKQLGDTMFGILSFGMLK